MRDLANSIAAVATVVPAVYGSDATGTTVDLAGFESATVVANIGVEGGTLSTTDKIALVLQHSDDNSVWTAVAQTEVVEGTVSGGVFFTADDNAEIPTVATIGYVGGKRYLRVNADFSGTHGSGTPFGAVILKAHPRHSADA